MKRWGCLFIVCLLIFSSCSKAPPKYQYKLAICAMFKDEAPWLKEWLEYHHQILGTDHFYLYNNDSSDDYMKVLGPYIEKGIVELIDWESSEDHAIWGINNDAPWNAYQFGSYNDCLKNRTLGKAQWVAVIDIDEFIVPVHGVDAFFAMLDKETHANTGSLRLFWRQFGTSDVWELKEGELLIEKLTRRAEDGYKRHTNGKSIHRPEAVHFCLIHEALKMKKGPKKRYRKKCLDPNEFRVNHYWAGPEKRFRGKRCFPEEQREKILKENNAVEDKTILQFVPKLRAILEGGTEGGSL